MLTDDELVAVWNACENIPPHFATALRLLALTGARRDEIGHLRWSEIQGNEIRLEGARTKNGQPHIIPLSPLAVAIVGEVQRIKNSPFVFTPNGNRPVAGWTPQKARLDQFAKIGPWVIHDLRQHRGDGTSEAQDAATGHRSDPGSHRGLSRRRGRDLSGVTITPIESRTCCRLMRRGDHVMGLVRR